MSQTHTDEDTDVLVVGAGTSGLTAALQANDHGARVRVVERRSELVRPSRALIVHPRSLEVLRPLGVTDALVARGDAAPSARLHVGRRVVTAALSELPLDDTAFPHLLLVPEATIEAVLSAALAARGVQVERGTELVAVCPTPEGAIARIRRQGREEAVMCRYVAGCDGPASTVRRAAGIGWRGGPYRQEVVLADIDVEGDLTPDVAHAVAGKDGMLFLFAIGERSTWRLLCTRPARGGGTPGQPDDPIPSHELDRLLQATGLGIRVAEIGWSARVPLEHRVATRYRAGPLFLAGDAAHVHSPAGGQGMNIGIQDAANLGWKLAFAASSADLSPETLLSSYEAERRPVARHVVALTQLLFWGEASTDRVASFIRRAAVPAIAPALPFMLRRRHLVAGGVRVLSHLNVGYPDSPISLEHGVRRRGLRAGDRVRDQSVTCEGRRRRLHELLAGPGVHLLLDRQASALTVADLGPHVHCHRIDDWPATGVLGVRPDGYIGYCDPTASPAHLREWLALIAADHQHQPARGDLHDHHS